MTWAVTVKWAGNNNRKISLLRRDGQGVIVVCTVVICTIIIHEATVQTTDGSRTAVFILLWTSPIIILIKISWRYGAHCILLAQHTITSHTRGINWKRNRHWQRQSIRNQSVKQLHIRQDRGRSARLSRSDEEKDGIIMREREKMWCKEKWTELGAN